jgi:hypothetical protein
MARLHVIGFLTLVVGCTSTHPTVLADAARDSALGDSPPRDSAPGDSVSMPADSSVAGACAEGDSAKIKFAKATACANDGSDEFCIPGGDPVTRAAVTAISATIACGPGGGHAGCSATPGLLLCMYPTKFPAQCVSPHGAMVDATWTDMCKLSALPQITEIVETIFE